MSGDDRAENMNPRRPSGDDDPTVYADEDLIRQIRVAGQQAASDVPLRGDGGDETVHMDDAVIAEIQAASRTVDSDHAASSDEDDDPTVFADEDLIRQIRIATGAEPAPTERADPVEGSSILAADVLEDEHTVVAGEQLIRELRVAGMAPPPSVAQHIDPGELEAPEASDVLGESVDRSVIQRAPDDPSVALEELRKRFAPEVKKPCGSVVPTWLLIAGIGLIVVLVVMVLAAVFVG